MARNKMKGSATNTSRNQGFRGFSWSAFGTILHALIACFVRLKNPIVLYACSVGVTTLLSMHLQKLTLSGRMLDITGIYDDRPRSNIKVCNTWYSAILEGINIEMEQPTETGDKNTSESGRYSIAALAVLMMLLSWVAFDALVSKNIGCKAVNAQQKMFVVIVIYTICEHLPMRDISDRLNNGNVLFHASGYYRKAILTIVVIYTQIWSSLIGCVGIIAYVINVVFSYIKLYSNPKSVFEIIDTYTDGAANMLMVSVVFIRIVCNTHDNKLWFTLACISELVGYMIANVLWFSNMDTYIFTQANHISIIRPILISFVLQMSLLILSKSELEHDDYLVKTRDVIRSILKFLKGD